MEKKSKKHNAGTRPQGGGEGARTRAARWNNENAVGIGLARKKIEHGIKKMEHGIREMHKDTGEMVDAYKKFAAECEGGGREMKEAIKSYSSDIKVRQKEMEQYARAFWS